MLRGIIPLTPAVERTEAARLERVRRLESDRLVPDMPCVAPIAPVDVERSQVERDAPLRTLPRFEGLAVTIGFMSFVISSFTAGLALERDVQLCRHGGPRSRDGRINPRPSALGFVDECDRAQHPHPTWIGPVAAWIRQVVHGVGCGRLRNWTGSENYNDDEADSTKGRGPRSRQSPTSARIRSRPCFTTWKGSCDHRSGLNNSSDSGPW